MLARRLVLFLLIYLALDLSNPLLPGAFTFDPDDSTDVIRSARVPVDEVGLQRLTTEPAVGASTTSERARVHRGRSVIPSTAVGVPITRSRSAPTGETPPPTEDH